MEPGNCKRPAGWGTSHLGYGACKLHGGSTPSAVLSAQRKEATDVMLTYGKPVDTNPIDALLQELRWTYGHVIWLRDQVQALSPEALIWGMNKRVGGAPAMELLDILGDAEVPPVAVEITQIAGVTVWVKLYQDERKHLVEVAATCARLGIDERKVRLAEQQGQLLVAGMRWFVSQLELTQIQIERANELAVQMFRFLDAGKVPAIT